MDKNDQSEIKQCKNNVSVPINYMSLFVHFDNELTTFRNRNYKFIFNVKNQPSE